MTCHAITASTLLVLQVINLLLNAVNVYCNVLMKTVFSAEVSLGNLAYLKRLPG